MLVVRAFGWAGLEGAGASIKRPQKTGIFSYAEILRKSFQSLKCSSGRGRFIGQNRQKIKKNFSVFRRFSGPVTLIIQTKNVIIRLTMKKAHDVAGHGLCFHLPCFPI
ncbi:hypothetical protein [Terasakiella pusilla]|uniref:hypothetical protein n=1 Tax=Terasakiella pusilla TaxID=64973 RepID=UPI003AA7FF52